MPVPATPRIEAPLIEVFSSMQGEGVLIGCRQIFVRFAECNLTCAYCDTPYQPTPQYRFETRPGSGQFSVGINPAPLTDITALVAAWQQESPGLHHSLVLTGGEPLLHADLLRQWLPSVKEHLPIFLETNGTLPEQLEKILPFLDWISMDVKLSSTSGQLTPWSEHEAFFAVAKDRLCQLKVVVDESTSAEELEQVANILSGSSGQVPLVLQPRTTSGGVAVSGAFLLKLQAVATSLYHDTRIIPQVHPWFGVA